MRTSTFVSLAFATLSLAAPAANPDPLFGFTFSINAPQNKVALALTEVTKSVNQLNTAIRAVKNFDISALATVARQGQAVGTVIKTAEANILAAPPVDNVAAIAVQNSARALAISINNVATSLIAKKAIVEKAGLTQSVVQMLQNQQAANSGLSKAVLAKVSAPVAQQSLQEDNKVVAQSLNRVVTAFSLGTAAAGTGARRIPQPSGTGARRVPQPSGTGAVRGGAKPLTTASPKAGSANSRGKQPVAAQAGAAQVGTAQAGASQAGVAQTGTARAGTAQAGTAQAGVAQPAIAAQDPKVVTPATNGSTKPATVAPAAADTARTPAVAAGGSVAAPAPVAAVPAAKASPATVAAPATQKGTTGTAGTVAAQSATSVTGSANAASVASN